MVLASLAFVLFTEDKLNLLWQTELCLYSMTHNAGIDPQNIFLFWADPNYYGRLNETQQARTAVPSPYLAGLIDSYPTMKVRYSQNFGRQNRIFRFRPSEWKGEAYPPLNKWASWIEWIPSQVFAGYTSIVLLEQDLWFYGQYPGLDGDNAVSYNYIPRRTGLFARNTSLPEWGRLRGFTSGAHPGYSIDSILRFTGTPEENLATWQPGAIIFKFATDTLTLGVVNDMINYQLLLLHLAEIAHPHGRHYETEMIGPGLALARHGVNMTLDRRPEWYTSTWCHKSHYVKNDIPPNTVVHYGWDFSRYAHLGKDQKGLKWSKHGYAKQAPWSEPGWKPRLEDLISAAAYPWTRKFFGDMIALAAAFPNVTRVSAKPVATLRV